MSITRVNKPDTDADIKLRECLTQTEKRNFLMIAGAGSGKTTSLIKALSTILSVHGKNLKKYRQRIACITYTEIAAREIWADVGNNPLVQVSTIHSFLWSVARSFQRDIHAWVLRRIDERVAELETEFSNFGSRVQQRTRDKNRKEIERYSASRDRVLSVRTFTYGTGSDYPKGILGHDDIIRLATDFLRESELFRTLMAQQFPFVFVDEGQDTQETVVLALKAVAAQAGKTFCLGFFGDPMQRIYPTGIGKIANDEEWISIDKEENFRCPTAVLSVANAVRKGGDSLTQTGGRKIDVNGVSTPVQGTARIFILPADDHRDERVSTVRARIARENNDPAWNEGDESDVKILVIVHRMAAKRLGFANLYAAMNDKAPKTFSNGFMEATSWPLRPFERFIMPLVEAIEAGNEFEAMSILRRNSPLLKAENVRGVNVAELLARLREGTQRLAEMARVDSTATVRDALTLVRDERLIHLDPRILDYLGDYQAETEEDSIEADADAQADDDQDEDERSKEISSMDRFLLCAVNEFRGYRRYLAQQSPFSTQQGIKGAEFERVLVILDDDEGTHVQFSYDKFFGVKKPSKGDLENLEQGKETAVERTRRLFYVCCTRALTDLAIIYFSTDPDLAEEKVRESEFFQASSIFNEASLA